MTSAPRLRRSYTATFRFAVGQAVRLCGFPATIHQRLRTAAGRALYVIQLAGEHFTRTVMEDGLEQLPTRPAKTRHRGDPILSARRPLLLLPPVDEPHLRAA